MRWGTRERSGWMASGTGSSGMAEGVDIAMEGDKVAALRGGRHERALPKAGDRADDDGRRRDPRSVSGVPMYGGFHGGGERGAAALLGRWLRVSVPHAGLYPKTVESTCTAAATHRDSCVRGGGRADHHAAAVRGVRRDLRLPGAGCNPVAGHAAPNAGCRWRERAGRSAGRNARRLRQLLPPLVRPGLRYLCGGVPAAAADRPGAAAQAGAEAGCPRLRAGGVLSRRG